MSQGEKRLQAMRTNPRADWKIEDIQVVCRSHGVACLAPTRGDHYKVGHSTQIDILTIPATRPIKVVYIKQFVAFIDAVKGACNGG